MNAMKSSSVSHRPESHPSVGHHLTQAVVKPFKAEIDLQSIDMKEISLKKYICDQCLDEFIHESSLHIHLERRSVRLTYLCDKCKSQLIFFNRCALLKHIRSHNENRELIEQKLSRVSVQPIDLSYLFSSANSANSADKQTENSMNNKIGFNNSINSINNNMKNQSFVCVVKSTPIETTVNSNTTISNRQTNEEIKEKLIKMNKNRNKNNKTMNTSNDLIPKKYVIKKSSNSELKCTQCNHSFNSLWTREQHLVDKQMVLPLNQCKLCPTICATNCSQALHNRLHTNWPVGERWCPECGTKLNESEDPMDAITHVVINCLHFSRRLIYNCMFCSHSMSSISAAVQHIKTVHTTQHFQCSQCLSKFETESQHKVHQTMSHSNADSKPIQLFECQICGTELNSMNTYSDHITSHRKKFSDFANFIYVCIECNESFVTKNDLKLHFNSFHLKDKTDSERKIFLKQISFQLKVKLELEANKSLNKFNNKTNNDFSGIKTNDDKRNASKVNGKDIESNEWPVKRVKTNVNDMAVNDDNQNNRKEKTNEANETQRVTNNNHFECRECGLNYPFVQTLKRHLILEHRIHDVESYINKTYIEIPIVVETEPELPKEVGEKKLSEILEKEDSTDTKCPICCLKFTDSKELKIHGRVHGMAFIKSCQKKSL